MSIQDTQIAHTNTQHVTCAWHLTVFGLSTEKEDPWRGQHPPIVYSCLAPGPWQFNLPSKALTNGCLFMGVIGGSRLVKIDNRLG